MKQVTAYLAKDGTLFAEEAECRRHEEAKAAGPLYDRLKHWLDADPKRPVHGMLVWFGENADQIRRFLP